MGLALGAVEVRGRKRQQHLVDGDEQELWAVLRLVPRHLHVLRAAKWHLREQLLQLSAEALALRRELPVHEVGLASGLRHARLGHRADDLGLDRSVRWEQLLDGAAGEVHAHFGQHGMHDARCALELRASRRVVT